MSYADFISQVVLAYRREHLNKQSAERDNVEALKHQAEHTFFPNRDPICFYMGADAYSDHKSRNPKLSNSKGDTFPVDDIANRCMGVEVICGPINTVFLYYTDDFIKKGSNLMVEVMRRAISKLRELLAEKGLMLPKTGYFSFDNCGENKNRSLFAYFAMLVELELFSVIEVYFLVVGHTHTPLDQYFSVLGRYLLGSIFLPCIL